MTGEKRVFKFGDVCRARCTAPARYFGDGFCLYISAQDNELGICKACARVDAEENIPLLYERELAVCACGYLRGRHSLGGAWK